MLIITCVKFLVMENRINFECFKAIMDADSVGYSFVKSFVDVLWNNKDSIGINNYVVLWKVKYNEDSVIKDFRFFSNEKEFDLSGINVDKLFSCSGGVTSESEEFQSMYLDSTFSQSHIIAIPVNSNANNESFFSTRGLILLFSQQGVIDIAKDEIGVFYYLLNSRKPNVLNDISVVNAIGELSQSENRNYSQYTQCFIDIGESLDKISSRFSSLGNISGLRHFSLWNYIHANVDIKTKLFSRNTYRNIAHSNTNIFVEENEKHFINDAISLYEKQEDVQILKCHTFEEIENSFADKGYLLDNGMDENNTTVITVVDGDADLKMDYPDRIINFYIANIVYTPFISKSFIKLFSKCITNSIRKCLVSCRDDILTELMEASIKYRKESEFYKHAENIIKKANEAEDVLIYLKDNGKYELKNPKEDGDKCYLEFKLPPKYQEDKGFDAWIKEVVSGKHYNSFHINFNNKLVKTAGFMRAYPNDKEKDCIIILINKQHKPSQSCVYYNNIFDKDNYYITAQCCTFLIQYQKMQDSIKNKNYLLQKLRHEIPSCTEAINNGIEDIKQALEFPEIQRNHVYTIANNMALNNSRVLLLAKFFSTLDFELEQFAKDKININLGTFLSSYIEIFRTEGLYKGVDVYFEIKDVESVSVFASNYFQLALVNVITNAIRYAASGTCVCIDIYTDKIVVRDLGIGISKAEMKLIFEEGFRGKEARRTNEKGMGYGLFLTQKVLEAHDFGIKVESALYCDQNYFAQAAVMRYLETLSVSERKKFILRDMSSAEILMALNIWDKISESPRFISDKKDYANVKIETIKQWVAYISENSEIFYDMDQEYFQEALHEVIFTINIK